MHLQKQSPWHERVGSQYASSQVNAFPPGEARTELIEALAALVVASARVYLVLSLAYPRINCERSTRFEAGAKKVQLARSPDHLSLAPHRQRYEFWWAMHCRIEATPFS